MSHAFLDAFQQGQRQFYIRLTPKASSTKLGAFEPREDGVMVLKSYVTSVPEKGKANAALIALLAKTLHIPKSAITITHGETDRNKTILITL